MFYQKFMILFVSVVFVSVLYAQEDASSLAGEAQSMADKISEVASELQGLASEAASSGDNKLKGCVDANLRVVKGLVSSANSMVSQITSLAASGKIDEAKNLLEGLSGMSENADQVLAKAQSCEGGSNQQKAATKKDSKAQNQNRVQTQAQVSADGSVTMTNTDGSNATSSDSSASVSDAMSMDIGSDLVTETERNVEGTDTSDAAGADAGGGLQSGSGDTSAIDEIAPEVGTVADDPQDVPVPVEEENDIIDQSPAK